MSAAAEVSVKSPPGWRADKLLAIFGHLLTDDHFARGVGSKISPEWFGNEVALQKARAIQLQHLDRYGHLPTPDEVKDGSCIQSEDAETRRLVAAGVDLALAARTKFGKDGLADEVRRWHKDLLFRGAAARAKRFYELGREEEAYSEMSAMVESVRQADNDLDYRHDWTTFRRILREKTEEYDGALTLGHPLIDHKLCPEGRGGSLLRHKSTIVEAGTNRGKSRFCTSVIAENTKQGADTLWFVNEDPEIDVTLNLWCAMLRMTPGEVIKFGSTPEGAQAMDLLAPYIDEHVDFCFVSPTGLTVESVVASVRRRQAARVAKKGKGYDLFVCDYPAKMISDRVQGDVRHVQGHVYRQLIGLGLEYGFHGLFPIQANRTGHVVGKGRSGLSKQENPRWLDERDIAETFNPAQDAANFISHNRTPDLAKRKLTVYYFCKSKSSDAVGWAVACRGDYGWALTHAPDLPAVCFQSDWAEPEKIEEWLKVYNGKAVPSECVK